ncbi:hypothetical protein LguiA_007877 [Lonicera macranthoides]
MNTSGSITSTLPTFTSAEDIINQEQRCGKTRETKHRFKKSEDNEYNSQIIISKFNFLLESMGVDTPIRDPRKNPNDLRELLVLGSGPTRAPETTLGGVIESILDTRRVASLESNSRKYLKKEKIIIAGNLSARLYFLSYSYYYRQEGKSCDTLHSTMLD